MNAAAPIFTTICTTICQIGERSKISTTAQTFKTCGKTLCLVLPLLCIGCEQTQEPEPAPPPVAQQPRPVLNRARSRIAQQQAPEQNSATDKFLSAVKAGDLTAVQAALDAGADPNTRDAQGRPALQLATVKKHTHVAKALLKKGADTEAVETTAHAPHFTPVQLAASNGDNATLQVLLDHGAHIDVQNPHTKHTALLLAVQKNHIDTVKILLERLREGASVNAAAPIFTTICTTICQIVGEVIIQGPRDDLIGGFHNQLNCVLRELSQLAIGQGCAFFQHAER